MQGSIPSYTPIEDNITTRPVHVSSCLDGNELIHHNEQPTKTPIAKTLNNLLLLQRSRAVPDLRNTLQYMIDKQDEFEKQIDAELKDATNKVVFSLVHHWVDKENDRLQNISLYDQLPPSQNYEEVLDAKIQILLVRKERIERRKTLMKMNITLDKPPMPVPGKITKRRLMKIIQRERQYNEFLTM